MREYEMAEQRALRHLKITDHMLTQTYPMLQDPKLLVTVLRNLFSALTEGINTLLYYDVEMKRIPQFSDTFENKLNLFRARCSRRYPFGTQYLSHINTIMEIVKQHNASPMEFSRRGQFVICSDNYRSVTTVSVKTLRQHIATAKGFIDEVRRAVNKDKNKDESEVRRAVNKDESEVRRAVNKDERSV